MPPHGKADRAASTPFSPLRFGVYARDLSRAVAALSRENMGGLSELKAELGNVANLDTLNVSFGDGRQHITLNGRTVTLGVHATADEIRKALGLSSMTDESPAAATPVPPNQIAPNALASISAKPAPVKPAMGSFAASLRAMMEQARAGVAQAQSDGLAKVKQAVDKLNDAKAATAQVSAIMAKAIDDEANSILAELGQISNLPPE